MNKNIKVILSRLIILFGLVYQLVFMNFFHKNQVSYLAFFILAIGAFLTIQSEENWLNIKFNNSYIILNELLFILQIILFLLISYFSYKYIS
jgi:hypothetical protein